MKNLYKGDTQDIIEYAEAKGVLRNQLAYILGTTEHETAGTMKPIEESGYLSKSAQLAYLKKKRYYPYYGRGYVQITWKENYEKVSKKYGVDFVEHPERVMEPEYAVPILVDGCMEGWFTGRAIPDYITLSKSNYASARKVVNGMDRAYHIAGLAEDYETALIVYGYGVDDSKATPVDKEKDVDELMEEVRKVVVKWLEN